jgi:hypothetical protein
MALDNRTEVYDSVDMTGGEFLRRLRKLGRRSGIAVRFDPEHGDGSHGRVYIGSAFTTLKDRKKELGKGLLHDMCAELGIDKKDL